MILRVIRGGAGADQLERLRRDLASKVGQGGTTDTPHRFHLGSRPAGDLLDVLLLSFWASPEAAARGDAHGISPLRLARRAELLDLSAAAFEIDEPVIRSSTTQPVALRVGLGRFSKPGADIEMLELLRQLAPQIGDEMSEAYVGRRILGRAVEVSFVSAWQSLPTDRRLEDALWPDVALRYDRFGVEVYRALPVGTADPDAG